MDLSEHERRALAEIERQLRDADPRFARSMHHGLRAGAERTSTGRDIVTGAAGLAALVCMSLSLIGPAVAAALLAVAAFYLTRR
jgi:hypothetical protein